MNETGIHLLKANLFKMRAVDQRCFKLIVKQSMTNSSLLKYYWSVFSGHPFLSVSLWIDGVANYSKLSNLHMSVDI